MKERSRHLDRIASLFDYPSERAQPDVRAACMEIERGDGALAEGARELGLLLDRGSGPAEEGFTRAFDVNGARSLEVGWHLYGEDYARGAFLVQMRSMLRTLGVEEGTELPDYLPTLLRALGRLPDGKAALFSTSYLQPALARMREGFEGASSAYGPLVGGLLEHLETTFGPTSEEPATPPAQARPYQTSPTCGAPPAPVDPRSS